jgi:hypothetical protein
MKTDLDTGSRRSSGLSDKWDNEDLASSGTEDDQSVLKFANVIMIGTSRGTAPLDYQKSVVLP